MKAMKFVTVVLAASVVALVPLSRADEAAPVAAAPPAAAQAPAVPAVPTTPTGMRTYTIQSGPSAVYVQVFKTGAAATLAHDHVVEAQDINGTISGDIADPTTAKIDATVKTATMTTDDPKSRARFRLEGELPEKDIAAVTANMKSADQLDVEKYPTIKFVSTAVKKQGDGLILEGDFTLHGVTKPISLPVSFTMKDANTVEGKGSFKIQTPDYGIQPYSAMLGAIKNKPEVIITLKLVAKAN
jgi:polyisoprenoid-binding protein YceI